MRFVKRVDASPSNPALLGIVCGSVLTALVGARAAHRIPVATLRRVFAVLL